MASTSLVAGLAAGLTPGSVADLTGGLTIEIIMLDLAGAIACWLVEGILSLFTPYYERRHFGL